MTEHCITLHKTGNKVGKGM